MVGILYEKYTRKSSISKAFVNEYQDVPILFEELGFFFIIRGVIKNFVDEDL